MSIVVMLFASLLLIVSAVGISQSFRQKTESTNNHGRLPKGSLAQFRKGVAMGVVGVVTGALLLGGSVYASARSTAKAATVAEDTEQKSAKATTPSETPKETEEEKAEREAKEAREKEEAEKQKSEQAQKEAALKTENSEDENGNYIPPATLSDEEWNLLFGRMSPYARRDSLPSMQLVRNHFSEFANPVGLPLIVDYEWIEAIFLGLARDDASKEIKELAEKGKTLNLLDEKQLSAVFEELDLQFKEWQKEFDELDHDDQELKLKLEVCEYILDSPVWAEQLLQYIEKNPYITANYSDTVKDLREYFDGILEPKDADGKPIPLEEAEAQGLGWNTVYEYAEGHEDDEAYRQTTLEYRKTVTPLCQIFLDFKYVGVTDKPLHRNWELKSGQQTSFLVTTLAKKIDKKQSHQFDLLAKDGKTVNLSICINCFDSRLGEYKAAKTVAIQKDEPTYVPPEKKPSKTNGGNPPGTTGIPKDPARGSGPSGNAEDFAGDNIEGNTNPGVVDNRTPDEKKQQEAEATKKQQEEENNKLKEEVTDPNSNNQNNTPPPTSTPITGENTNSNATGTDNGTGETVKPSEENNSGKVTIAD